MLSNSSRQGSRYAKAIFIDVICPWLVSLSNGFSKSTLTPSQWLSPQILIDLKLHSRQKGQEIRYQKPDQISSRPPLPPRISQKPFQRVSHSFFLYSPPLCLSHFLLHSLPHFTSLTLLPSITLSLPLCNRRYFKERYLFFPKRYLSIYLSRYIGIYLSICLGIYLSVSVYRYLSIYLSRYIGIYLSIYLSRYIGIYLSIYLSRYIGIYLSIYLSRYIGIYLSLCLCLGIYLSVSVYRLSICLYIGIYLSVSFGIYLSICPYIGIYIYQSVSHPCI
ncbi:unnamed protein product [Acanthosepion pharaonis]|uniref:Uncharacterized protein n=1 Tax=Acanthosepion pharaonis TaxID=158019 RepID=A0A812C3C3_ACAPH|nr:unnamed protein product [Sepia pharaonis]